MSRRGALLRTAAVAWLVGACACDDDALTELLVVADTELTVPVEADKLVLVVTGPSGVTREASASLEEHRPIVLALVPPAGERGGAVTVRVEARRAGVAVASRTVSTAFAPGRVKELPVCVARDCATSCADLTVAGAELADWSGSASSSPCGPPGAGEAGVPDGGVDTGPDGALPPDGTLGKLAFVRQVEGDPPAGGIFLWKVELREGSDPESLSERWAPTLTPRPMRSDDRDGAFSWDGDWMVAALARGECADWRCVFLGPANDPESMVALYAVDTDDHYLHVEHPAITNDAQTLVYDNAGHIFVTRRTGEIWGPATAISLDSPLPYNRLPRLSPDETRVVFSCSGEFFGYASICEVGLDGSGLRVVLGPSEPPPPLVAAMDASLDNAVYAPDGAIVFEAPWAGQQLWRIPPGGSVPERLLDARIEGIGQPCVLPSGHLVAYHTDNGLEVPTFAIVSPEGRILYELATGAAPGELVFVNGCGP